MKKYWMVGVVVVTLAIVAGFTWYMLAQRDTWRTETITDPKLSFAYPDSFDKKALSKEDADNLILARLTNNTDELKTPFLLTVRYEKGLRAVAAVTQQGVVDMLVRNIEKAYPIRFSDYSQVSQRKFEFKSHDAAEVVFTYTGNDGSTVKQRFILISLDGDKVVYVAAQAISSDFDALNSKYFGRVFESLSFD